MKIPMKDRMTGMKMRPLLAGDTYFDRTIVTITSDTASRKKIVEYTDKTGTHYVSQSKFRDWIADEGYRQSTEAVAEDDCSYLRALLYGD